MQGPLSRPLPRALHHLNPLPPPFREQTSSCVCLPFATELRWLMKSASKALYICRNCAVPAEVLKPPEFDLRCICVPFNWLSWLSWQWRLIGQLQESAPPNVFKRQLEQSPPPPPPKLAWVWSGLHNGCGLRSTLQLNALPDAPRTLVAPKTAAQKGRQLVRALPNSGANACMQQLDMKPQYSCFT